MSSSERYGDATICIFPPSEAISAIPLEISTNDEDEKKPTALLYDTDSRNSGI